MNKQEALEALLTKEREWEAETEEVRATPPGLVLEVLHASTMRLMDMREAEVPSLSDYRAALIRAGAAALYLLVDEVEIVAGATLDAWLAEQKLVGYRLPSGVQPGPGGARANQ